MDDSNKKKLLLTLSGVFLLYLLSAGVSYAVFKYLAFPSGEGQIISPVSPPEGEKRSLDLSAPKTAACPINGDYFTEGERKIWEERRPLLVMIENHEEARPQSGLSKADVVYEVVAEGGITRFLAAFYCGVAAEEIIIGPVRSARIYYMDLAAEYGKDPLYVHAGGANDFHQTGDTAPKAKALEKISSLGWTLYNDLNYDSVGLPTFWRDTKRLGREVAWEHTLYSSSEKLWELAAKRGLEATSKKGVSWDEGFVLWKFKDEAKSDDRGEITSISFDFWAGEIQAPYHVEWKYNREKNFYSRFNGGQPLKDRDNDEQLEAKVVVVQFAKEEGPIDRNKHLYYTLAGGKGKAIIFQDGQATEGNWTKKDMKSRTVFTNNRGKEIVFNRGQVWVEILPTGQKVSY